MATIKKMKKAQDGIMSTKLKDVPGKVKSAVNRTVDKVKNSTVGDAVDVMAPGVRKAVSAGSKAYKSFKDQVGSMNKGLPKKKNGGSVAAGTKAPGKRVGPVDPKGAYTKVQKRTLAGAKGKASLTKDKQLGATKMKMGGKMAKCKYGCK